MGVAARSETLEDVHVECTHCGLRMSGHLGSGQRVRYFRCGGCQRWVSSAYADVFRADAKVRTHPKRDEETEDRGFEDVKARLERWLMGLEEQDPYRILGLSPLASPKDVRERYRELAFRVHPDRGGSADRMRELNLAYERIVRHQERRRSTTLPASSPAESTVLPPRSR